MDEFHELQVTEARRLGGDIAYFSLTSLDGAALWPFDAGAHVNVEVRPGLVRQYSLLGDPADLTTYHIAVKRIAASRGGSRAMHELLSAVSSASRSATRLRVSRPRNHFPLAPDGQHHVLLGAGIGITPLLSMAWALWRQERPFSLDYFPGRADTDAFKDLLGTAPYARAATTHQGIDRTAISAVVRQRIAAAPSGSQYYVCGPEGFMEGAVGIAQDLGAEGRIHLERFQASMEAPPSVQAASFRIVLARAGRELTVPADRTIADVLEEHHVQCDTGCRQGVCGTCVTMVLGGTPDHRDCVLTPEERLSNELMCVCVSRSLTPVLHLDL